MTNDSPSLYDEQDNSDNDRDIYSSESSSSYDSESDDSSSSSSSSSGHHPGADGDTDNSNNRISPSLLVSYHHHHDHSRSSTIPINATMRRRRGSQHALQSSSQRDNRNEADLENFYSPAKRRRGSANKKKKKNRYLLVRIYDIWCRLSSYFLILAIIIWVLVQIYGMLVHGPQESGMFAATTRPRNTIRLSPQEFWHRFDDRDEDEEAPANWLGFTQKEKNKKQSNKEVIPDGCELQEWQQVGHPNCMELHQLDLPLLLNDAFSSRDNNTNNTTLRQGGKYLSSGMWRDVFRLPAVMGGNKNVTEQHHHHDDHHYDHDAVVLKMMKSEHDVDDRNLERHKREAIVMDVLTKSPNIVNLFAYCGNSILTEYLAMDLEAYLRPRSRRKRRKKVRRGQKEEESLTEHQAPRVTTPEERLDLALQTAKALQVLHEYDIIHADLQSKQFLVDFDDDNSTTRVTIKLNDFNRCRFLPREQNNSSLPMNSSVVVPPFPPPPPICPIMIPTAPGLARSPEEYEMQPLTTQLDVYSLANVWYQILTGSSPWVDQANTNVVKNLILDGKKPPLPVDQTNNNTTTDSVVADWLYSAYEIDPNQRATAKDLVQGLEHLLP
ncbi:unnamed protein product [Cylindrotheca closterium]|uniref:Protein kinase domain-containing protein n=1 Tax=Cylindrotheca closterium TaxID=2856 RepID=A0AAD2G7R4_9STRA|nr:unnamed protein product [Cylindrotheca closterium]